MKKRNCLLSLILACVMCFGVVGVATASENGSDGANNNMAKALSGYSVKVCNSMECENSIQLVNGQEVVNVNIMTSDKNISESDIKKAYYYAQSALLAEANTVLDEDVSQLFNYTLIMDDIVYFYEKNDREMNNSTMDIYQVPQKELASMEEDLKRYEGFLEEKNVNAANAISSFEISDGFGGKVVINNTSNKYLSFNVELPTIEEVAWANTPSNSVPTAYLYGGFEGGIGVVPGTSTSKQYSSDIGLQYSSNLKLWKPFLNIEKYTYTGKPLSGYNNVHTNNGFLPSEDESNRRSVSITIHVNNDQANGLKGSVRLKAVGLAKYPTANSTIAEPTKLTAIIESADSDQSTGVVKALNISKVSNYKLLCLIALGNDINDDAKTIGTNWCKYTNITIGGTTVSLDNMKFYQEHASFPSMSNGNVEIQVSK